MERADVTKNVGNIVSVGLYKWNNNQYIKVILLILWSDNDAKNAVVWSSLQKAVNESAMYLEVNRWEDIGPCLIEVRDFSVRK